MNMQTKVVRVDLGAGISPNTAFSEINSEIKKKENNGWYLRGTPVYIKELDTMMLTFETPEADDSEKSSEAGMPAEVRP